MVENSTISYQKSLWLVLSRELAYIERMECRLSRPCVISLMTVFCVHLVIYQAASAAGIARSLQMSSSLTGQAAQYVMAGDTARPSQYKSAPPLLSSSRTTQDSVLGQLSMVFGLCGLAYARYDRNDIYVQYKPKTEIARNLSRCRTPSIASKIHIEKNFMKTRI
jgi:hypothetical protein